MTKVKLTMPDNPRLFYEYDDESVPLGQGGMGCVYKGVRFDLDRNQSWNVAIKKLNCPEDLIKRAKREASIQINSDYLLKLYGFIEVQFIDKYGFQKKECYVISELLEGVMLDDLLTGKTTDYLGNSIPYAEELYRELQSDRMAFSKKIIRAILSGIFALHEKGYIHRDIDPTNIMITKDKKIKLIDFGIAKPLDNLNTQDKGLTEAGVFLGKPWYAAPELVLGDLSNQSKVTDIYAIGILLYELYTGKRPFEGSRAEVLDMQLRKKMPLNNIKERNLQRIIRKATEKKGAKRYQTANEFIVALDAPAPPPLKPIVASCIGCLIIAGIAYIWPSPPPPPPPIPDMDSKYSLAIQQLSSTQKETAHKGLQSLHELADKNHPKSLYLLSKLYADSTAKWDVTPDSIKIMRSHLDGFICDPIESVGLLQKSIKNDSSMFDALYDMGIYYLKNRNLLESERYLQKAKAKAINENQRNKANSVLKEYRIDFEKEKGGKQ